MGDQVDLTVIRVESLEELPRQYRPLGEMPAKGTVYVYDGHEYRQGEKVIGRHRIIALAVEKKVDDGR